MKHFLTPLLFFVSVALTAQENPLWMRYPAISPDGQTIAFAYKGDLFTVGVNGGQARQLTTNAAYDSRPVWSPDGQTIAFASNREGSLDVYIINKVGGAPKRLTTHSANEVPVAWTDNSHVLFKSALMPTAQWGMLPESTFPQIYEVDINASRPRLYSPVTMEDISINSRGELLYHDVKGYEDPWRKHHVSAICRDIWLLKDGSYKKLTQFRGEDRSPVWALDEQSFYYLSEQDGTFNVWHRSLDGNSDRQLTHHSKNPVRFLTMSRQGTLCYGYDGEIYTLRNGQETKVPVTIVADSSDKLLQRQLRSSGARQIKLSPSGKEIAFVMHGDVYVTSVDYKTTKQITDTPEQERSIDFSPDGRAIVYDSERNGYWQIYQTRIKNASEKNFVYASELVEEQLVNSQRTSLQPQYSPDGKEVAFFEDRGALCIVNLKSRQVRQVLDGKYNYSYSDGDLWFQWSPDSKWLLSSYIGTGGWNSQDVALVDASGSGRVMNITESGYTDANAKWALGGRAVVYESDRAGYRSHGSWGAESDVYLMFFCVDDYERFRMSKEEKTLYDDAKKEAAKKKAADDKDKKGKKSKDSEEAKAPTLDFTPEMIEDARDRIVRLTVNSSHLGDFVLSPGGDTLYYQASFEGGADLWKHDLRENKTEIVLKGVGGGRLIADKQFKNLFLSGRSIKKLDLAKKSSTNIDFEAPFNFRPYEERSYLYSHVWQQVLDKFYEPGMQGVDWQYYRGVYEKFLPHINNNYDFAELLSELLGELNASHTGARYRADGASLKTASLGVFLDESYQGDGLRIEEVIRRSPLALKGVAAGSIITAIDGQPIRQGEDYNHLLDGKAGKPVRLTIDGKTVQMKPISMAQLDNLLYKRWVDRNRYLVDSLSGGRLAYVHIKSMNSDNFREVYSQLLSDKNRNRQAVIVDERYNGGGWLHEDLCTLLSGFKYHDFVPHGKFVGVDPYNKWTKPSCVLMNEDCYSNGEGFPWVYREHGIGKLIGTPVAGTATSVWWETLMDESLVFGIPQVGKIDNRGQYTENTELFPDIEVYNTPEDNLAGRDRQLERAVEEMLKLTSK